MTFYRMGTEAGMIEDALEAGGMAWWVMELPSGVVFFSPNKIQILGYNRKDTDKFLHYTSFTDLLHPEDYDHCMKAMEDLISGATEVYETQYRIKAVDGTYVTLYDRGRIVGKKENGQLAIAGIVLDVTHNPLLLNEQKPATESKKITKKKL